MDVGRGGKSCASASCNHAESPAEARADGAVKRSADGGPDGSTRECAPCNGADDGCRRTREDAAISVPSPDGLPVADLCQRAALCPPSIPAKAPIPRPRTLPMIVPTGPPTAVRSNGCPGTRSCDGTRQCASYRSVVGVAAASHCLYLPVAWFADEWTSVRRG